MQKRMTRAVRYICAMSLDGYIAGPNGEHDWIVMDPDINFAESSAQFDVFLIGRKTFEAMQRMGDTFRSTPEVQNIVFSRTLKQSDYPNLTVRSDIEKTVAELRASPGKDIWLFGGGELFRSLLAAGLVDSVEVAVMPVLLGAGIPLLAAPSAGATLRLRNQRLYQRTGTMALEYDVVQRPQ